MAKLSLKTWAPLLLVAASTAIAVVLILARPDNVIEPARTIVPLVDVAEVVRQDLRIPVQAQGTVTPHRDTTLVAEVSGKIIEVSPNYNAGGYVAKGDVLARIDDRDYQAAVLRARAQVETAESNLAQEKGRAAVAQREWEKLPNRGSRSQEARDLYLRKPQLEQAEAQLHSAQADLNKAKDDLERTVIRAPYDALIQQKHSDLGRFVAPGTSIARVFAVDFAEVRLAIPQGKLAYLELPGVNGYKLDEAPPVDLYTDIGGTVTHWTAHLDRTEAALDERSRVLFAVARIDDPYALGVGDHEPLRIGTFVKANIIGKVMDDLVVLPRYVVRAGNLVWVVDEQDTLRNRQVTTLRTGGDEVYVSGGLQDGDLVALTLLNDALPGMTVEIGERTSTRRQETLMEAAGNPAAATPEPSDPAPAEPPDQTSTESDAQEAARATAA